jgi:hypothetical protein
MPYDDMLATRPTTTKSEEREPSTGSNWILESGVYPMIIDMAYRKEAASGSIGLHLHLKSKEHPTIVHKERFTLTSGHAKGQKNYFVDKEGVEKLLPQMQMANELCQLAFDDPKTELAEYPREDKMIKLWDYDQKADVPVKVSAYVDLIGKEIMVGMVKIATNKRKQVGDKWVPTSGVKEYNEVSKFYHPESGLTAQEIEDGKTQPEHLEAWKEKHDHKTIDHYTKVEESSADSSDDDLPLFS